MFTIDTREPATYRKAVEEALRPMDAVDVTTLETGDYAWSTADGGQVVVERKTVSDLVNSTHTDRWASQIRRLAELPRPFVLIEGSVNYYTNGAIHAGGQDFPGWDVVRWNSLLATAQEVGVRIIFSAAGKGGVAAALKGMYAYSNKEHHESLDLKTRKTALTTEGYALAVLEALPGLGATTARKLLAAYRTAWWVLDAIMNDDLALTPGIGPNKVAQWREVLVHGGL